MQNNSIKAEEEGRHIDILVREGRLTEERVAVAGGLFHTGARASSIQPVLLVHDYRERLFVALKTLNDRSIMQFSYQCLSRVLSKWEEVRKDDSRPLEAFRSVGQWVKQKDSDISESTFRQLAESASEASVDLDDEFHGEMLPPHIASAVLVAQATSDLAFAAAMAVRDEFREVSIDHPAHAASLAVNGAAQSAPNLLDEMSSQIHMLISFLLAPST